MKTLVNLIEKYEITNNDDILLYSQNLKNDSEKKLELDSISLGKINYNENNNNYECNEIVKGIKNINEENEEKIYYPFLFWNNDILGNVFIYMCSDNKKYYMSDNENNIGRDITEQVKSLNLDKKNFFRLNNGYFLSTRLRKENSIRIDLINAKNTLNLKFKYVITLNKIINSYWITELNYETYIIIYYELKNIVTTEIIHLDTNEQIKIMDDLISDKAYLKFKYNLSELQPKRINFEYEKGTLSCIVSYSSKILFCINGSYLHVYDLNNDKIIMNFYYKINKCQNMIFNKRGIILLFLEDNNLKYINIDIHYYNFGDMEKSNNIYFNYE